MLRQNYLWWLKKMSATATARTCKPYGIMACVCVCGQLTAQHTLGNNCLSIVDSGWLKALNLKDFNSEQHCLRALNTSITRTQRCHGLLRPVLHLSKVKEYLDPYRLRTLSSKAGKKRREHCLLMISSALFIFYTFR